MVNKKRKDFKMNKIKEHKELQELSKYVYKEKDSK